jgi:hypothetical protein
MIFATSLFRPFAFLFILLSSSTIFAQTTYYSKGNLPVSDLISWSSNAAGTGGSPSAFGTANTFVIQNGHSMTFTSAATWSIGSGTLRIENGGTWTNSGTGTATMSIFKIYGGGTYIHNSTSNISATNCQFANSTNGGNGNGSIIIQNYSNGVALPITTYGNLTVEYAGTSSAGWSQVGGITQVEGNFTLNTNSAFPFRFTGTGTSNYSLTVAGNLVITSGLLQFNNGTGGTSFTLNLGGNFSQTGGTFNPNTSTVPLTINFTGSGKTFEQSGGTLTNSAIKWAVNQGASLSLLSNLPVASSRTLTVNGTLNCGISKVTGAGSVTVSSTGTLKLGSLNSTSALGDNIAATLNTLPAGSTIEYNGSSTQFESSQTVANLTISNTSGLFLPSNNVLTVKGNLTNNGNVAGAGKLVMNSSTSSQTISGNGTIANLEVDNANGVSITSDTLKLTGLFSATSGTFTTNGRLVLRSNSFTTAKVGPITGTISGLVSVERHIPKASGILSTGRAWRLITAPVKGATNNSLFYNWQNNGLSNASSGIEIWGPVGSGAAGNGLSYGSGYSAKKYDAVNNIWVNVSNTTTENLFDNTINKPVLAFCTGPYGSNYISSGSDSTVLKAAGSLITGTQTYNFTPTGSNNLQLLANPYACAIDFDKVFLNSGTTNIRRKFWVVDPNINEVGGYVLVQYNTNTSSYDVTPSTSAQTQYIQNGQSFFVQDSSTGIATIAIEEDDKETTASNNNNAVFRTNGGVLETLKIQLKAVPLNASPVAVDEALINCHQNSSLGVNEEEDGIKFLNFHESVAVVNGATKLSIDGRPLLDNGDTVRITLTGMRQRNYHIELHPGNLNVPGLSANLIDSYLNMTTPISLSNATSYSFSVDTNTSSAGNRFYIVFANSTPLDLRFISVTAREKDSEEAEISWIVNSEEGISSYVIEKSLDGEEFSAIGNLVAGKGPAYIWIDKSKRRSNIYYRVKALSERGKPLYSPVAKLIAKGQTVSFSVFPNPIADGVVHFELSGGSMDACKLLVVDAMGKVVEDRAVAAGIGTKRGTINFKFLAAGTYLIKVLDDNGSVIAEQKSIVQ